MRVYISSAPEELEPYQAAAFEIARGLGYQPMVRDPTAGRGLDPVRECARQVAGSDLLLAIVGWRRGPGPAPELGGDGLLPWACWEVRSAFDHGKPVIALLAADAWRPELREDDPEGRAVMQDFRAELGRLGAIFGGSPLDDAAGDGALRDFRDKVRRQLVTARSPTDPEETTFGTRLRQWPEPKLPAHPYPLLLPYTHPDLFAGRERELVELRRMLALSIPVVGLYAASGAGKSSLLSGGLVPRLRAKGLPVALDRHPCEPGIAGRLLCEILDGGEKDLAAIDDGDHDAFVQHLLDVLVLTRGVAGDETFGAETLAQGLLDAVGAGDESGRPAILVVDQFEDVFRLPSGRRARAVLGLLLAATAQRLPGLDGPPCHWLLAYRQEYHGRVCQWLSDVLADARREGLEGASHLPHDLAGSERFQSWPLQTLGTPPPGSAEPVDAAARIFQAAIVTPLRLGRGAGDDGASLYPWRFAPGHAERLARAFGQARVDRPIAPLAPELQVVLAHLLESAEELDAWDAGDSGGEEQLVVAVPEDCAALIDQALEEHLRRTLERAFPGDGAAAELGRTRAVLALRELADLNGRRDEGLPADQLVRAIGSGDGRTQGREVLEKLATSSARLVVLERHGEEWIYVLSHDRLAEILVRCVDEGHHGGLGIDAGLLELRRFVRLQNQLFAAGELEQATRISSAQLAAVEEHADAVLWSDEQRRWLAACRERRRRARRRRWAQRAGALAVLALVALAAWKWADRRSRRRALFDQVVTGEPEAAASALVELIGESFALDTPGAQWSASEAARELLARWRQRQEPWDLVERGLGGLDEGRRAVGLLRLVELALPLVAETPESPAWIATVAWRLDFFAPEDAQSQARALREKLLEPLRRRRPPPALSAGEGVHLLPMVEIPGGVFAMGSPLGQGRDERKYRDERPVHQVEISGFCLGVYEVTHAAYRLFDAGHPGEGSLPLTDVSWYRAYTYAAWLGGRLPTEAEWEYAARYGCEAAFCRRDGSPAELGEIAWWVGNAADPRTGELALHPVGRLEPNPLGLHDLIGNAWELVADWYGPYPERQVKDPPGPISCNGDVRLRRGGGVRNHEDYAAVAGRGNTESAMELPMTGFRVMLPACEQ